MCSDKVTDLGSRKWAIVQIRDLVAELDLIHGDLLEGEFPLDELEMQSGTVQTIVDAMAPWRRK